MLKKAQKESRKSGYLDLENKDIYRVLKEYKITKRIEDAFGSLFFSKEGNDNEKATSPLCFMSYFTNKKIKKIEENDT